MMRGMFAAISGLKNHQIMLDVTANDIANVNTIGYKSARTTFKDSLTQVQRGAAGPTGQNAGSNAAQIGLGAAPAVPNTVEFTRAGNFTRNQAGYLTTQEGFYVVGRGAAGSGGADTLIQIPGDASGVAIGQDGGVSYIPGGGGARQVAGYLSLATFANPAGLERTSGNRWIASANSGAETTGTPGGTLGMTTAGAIEMSNVDLAQSFTTMITSQRGFQANSRVISTSDEMLQDLVNLKR